MRPDDLKAVWRGVLPYAVIALLIGALATYGLFKLITTGNSPW